MFQLCRSWFLFFLRLWFAFPSKFLHSLVLPVYMVWSFVLVLSLYLQIYKPTFSFFYNIIGIVLDCSFSSIYLSPQPSCFASKNLIQEVLSRQLLFHIIFYFKEFIRLINLPTFPVKAVLLASFENSINLFLYYRSTIFPALYVLYVAYVYINLYFPNKTSLRAGSK